MLSSILKLFSPAHRFAAQGSLSTNTIRLDYPITPRRREYQKAWGGQQISSMLDQSAEPSNNLLQAIREFHSDLARIPVVSSADGDSPFWDNPWMPALDAMSIYALIRSIKPATYFEVGSGTSTKFARRAISDGRLNTRIVSVDPSPRAEIDRLCDSVIRSKFEDLDVSNYLSRLKPGDIVFIDNSHRSFQSSDVTVFFTEMLPVLPPGTVWGLHDIFLPFGYPEEWLQRFYNEQYLLAAYLLGGHALDEVVFPAAYSSQMPSIANALSQAYAIPPLEGIAKGGVCFWMRRRDNPLAIPSDAPSASHKPAS